MAKLLPSPVSTAKIPIWVPPAVWNCPTVLSDFLSPTAERLFSPSKGARLPRLRPSLSRLPLRSNSLFTKVRTPTGYDNSGSIIRINNSAIAGGAGGSVSYTGRNGVEINGNYIELETTAKNAIDSVGGIATDVGTLKTASAGWNEVSAKLDTTAFSTVSGTFLTKSSADNDYAPKSVTATVNTLTGASGNWQESYEVLTAYSAAGTWLTAHQSLTNYYTKSETSGATELSTEFAKYQPTGDYVTSAGLTAGKQYAMTTTGWEVVQAGTSFTGVTTASPITGDGLNNTLGLDSNYKTAIEARFFLS